MSKLPPQAMGAHVNLLIQKNRKFGLTSLLYTNQLDIQGTFEKYLTSVN